MQSTPTGPPLWAQAASAQVACAHPERFDAKVEQAGHRQVMSHRYAALERIRHALESVANDHGDDCHDRQRYCGPQKAQETSHLQPQVCEDQCPSIKRSQKEAMGAPS